MTSPEAKLQEFMLDRRRDTIRKRLLNCNEWKVKTGMQLRLEYEVRRKQKKASVIDSKDESMEVKEDFTEIAKKPKKQTGAMPRFSRVLSRKSKSGFGAEKKKSKRDEKKQLQELMYDKQYINRLLWDEHVRILLLRGSKLNKKVLKNRPTIRLWLETMATKISRDSKDLRSLMKQELTFLKSRYEVQRQLHFWHTFNSLNLDQMYDKKRQRAFRYRIRIDHASEMLGLVWRWFNKGEYRRVEKVTLSLIQSLERWKDNSPSSAKFKLLADLYYARGLSMMFTENFEGAYRCFRKDGEIGEFTNLKVIKDRTKDNMARVQAIKSNYRQAIKLWSERIEELETEKELAWAKYNVALCHALDENYELALQYAEMSVKHAVASKSYVWELNANMLISNCAAMLGSIKEASVHSNTVVSLKALNRAYQCAVYLANVSVIQKIMEIAVNIYNSFKGIDLTMLLDVWSPNLVDYAQKGSNINAEKKSEENNMNMSNISRNIRSLAKEQNYFLRHKLATNVNNSRTSLSSAKTTTMGADTLQLVSNSTTQKQRKQRQQQKQKQQDSAVQVVTVDNEPTSTTPININCQEFSKLSSPVTAVEVLATEHDYLTSVDDFKEASHADLETKVDNNTEVDDNIVDAVSYSEVGDSQTVDVITASDDDDDDDNDSNMNVTSSKDVSEDDNANYDDDDDDDNDKHVTNDKVVDINEDDDDDDKNVTIDNEGDEDYDDDDDDVWITESETEVTM